ncbi:hypothetical protein [Hydrogenophaga sp.]|uniref:hypothetical protein n=1 Tax=Hydrogenophaga sp. TaxID=1904254 RepID=UPI00272F8958|nr:hypothetical protein [Hydrogenophaga sp.]MDP1684472.1 hypothetical protein [Hydrogenophaga sp.]
MNKNPSLFAWHRDVHCATAASGVVYDAIALQIPILGRSGGLLSQLELDEFPIRVMFDDISQVMAYLADREKLQED